MDSATPTITGEVARAAGRRGAPVALVIGPTGGAGLAAGSRTWAVPAASTAAVVAAVEDAVRPRWVMWSQATALALARSGVRVAVSWDLVAVHRLLCGGWSAGPAAVWAAAHDLDPAGAPPGGETTLFSPPEVGDEEDPVRPDGYLRPGWVAGCWHARPEWAASWAAVTLRAAHAQRARLDPVSPTTAHCESTTELLCAEMTVDGLPMDRGVAESVVEAAVGPRPTDAAAAASARGRRDAEVLRHVGDGADVDLRSSTQVRRVLTGLGIDVPDTRAWRLRPLAGRHPFVPALLAWRKADRIGSTHGYGWLDDHLGADGRLRGTWSGSDGAAGRMTATAGLHNMPAELRVAVRAEPGHRLVCADLGQVEPRVLAAISGDAALSAAGRIDDLYAPVAAQLGVDRAAAKLAVLGAMYGQTTGLGADALGRLRASYPVAMAYLEAGARKAEAGRDLRTHGGRLVPMNRPATPAAAATQGRYGRNALVQGAAAELFKTWVVTFRSVAADLGAQIVLCLHDEVLLHVADDKASTAVEVLRATLAGAVRSCLGATTVHFPVEVAVVDRWSEAKAGAGP